ncbi:MAG: hypothetical protein NTY17_05620 [Planctomycetia bacterium]|nr:hypothetical protein [Planctomycetia bacterium]
MTLLIGTDEAGYGPNLGPLVVAATAWRVDTPAEDAETVLTTAMLEVDAATGAGRGTPLWADSKQIYRGGAGFDRLERGVLIGLKLASDALPGSWTELAERVGPISPRNGCRDEWQDLAPLTVPREADAAECIDRATAVRDLLACRGVVLERVACRGIYPDEFNRLLNDGLNKSDILSAATLDLAATLRAVAPDEPAIIWCDRHGGRKRYGGLVARHFDATLVQPLEETPARSAYLVPAGDRPPTQACRIEFCVGGESRAPVALASMAAKYVRELSMHAFNTFWAARVPGLRPTAGYPTDAQRWRGDAAAAIQQARFAADDLWRRL